ncbi:MAG TPA: helix-turn-helix domain-containing protein [Phycisphaerae bacterium]|nr:helix-turn-helix domain-containing protein [Phycisphaerae bacterium]HPS52378.1 helix-turn-helix domain-containing protein [Phycisphaerae bacterium]
MALSLQRRQNDIGLHTHEFMELVITTSGRGLHYTQDEEYPIRRGDVFVIQPSHPHGYRQTRSLCIMNILFDLSWFDRLTAEIPKKQGFYFLFQSDRHRDTSHMQLSDSELKKVQSLLSSIQKQMPAIKSSGNNLIAAGLLLEIAGFLSTCYKSDAPTSVSVLQTDAVMEYIEKNYADEISLAQLSDIAKISSRNLLRIFRRATGTTPVDYLLHYRISRACRLLTETDKPVTKIAFDVGFSDGNYFCRQFKKIIRISPARYRAMQALLK